MIDLVQELFYSLIQHILWSAYSVPDIGIHQGKKLDKNPCPGAAYIHGVEDRQK